MGLTGNQPQSIKRCVGSEGGKRTRDFFEEDIDMRNRNLGILILGAALLLICGQPLIAKSDRGYLTVHVSPPETYIYADGEPVVESNRHYIILTAGEHQIDLYNYGYKPETRKVTITAKKWWNIRVEMQPIPGRISGPWGCITLEGAPRAAVLLNGKDPAVFFCRARRRIQQRVDVASGIGCAAR
jgi:hypothetical protein